MFRWFLSLGFGNGNEKEEEEEEEERAHGKTPYIRFKRNERNSGTFMLLLKQNTRATCTCAKKAGSSGL